MDGNATLLVKIQAIRKDAKRLTGTKDSSGSRYNAVRLELRARDVVVDGEDREEFVRSTEMLLVDLELEDELTNILAERITMMAWRLRCAFRIEPFYISSTYKRSMRQWSRLKGTDEEAPLHVPWAWRVIVRGRDHDSVGRCTLS